MSPVTISLEHCLYAANVRGPRKEKPYAHYQLRAALFPLQHVGTPTCEKMDAELWAALKVGANTGFFEEIKRDKPLVPVYKLTQKGFDFLSYCRAADIQLAELRERAYKGNRPADPGHSH